MIGGNEGYTSIAILVVVLAIAAVGFMHVTSDEYQQQMEEHKIQSQAYCEQVYNDSSVYTANVVGNHGGLHCVENSGTPHLHAIPQEYKEQAYQAQQNGTDLGWTIETMKEHAERTPWYRPYLEVLPLAVIMTILAIGAGYYMKYRHKGKE